MIDTTKRRTNVIIFYSLHIPIILLALLLLGAGIILFEKATSEDSDLISNDAEIEFTLVE